MFKIPIERPQSTNRSGNKNLKASLVSSILPKKTNKKIRLNYYDTSGRLVFVRFLEELEDTKKTFRNQVTIIEFKTTQKSRCKFFSSHFSNDNSIANISIYTLSRPKLNFGRYLTFE
jgi:hypothetical protein